MSEDSFIFEFQKHLKALFAKLEDTLGRCFDMEKKKKTMKKNTKQKLQPSWILQRKQKIGLKVDYNKQKAFWKIGLGEENKKLEEHLAEIETNWNLQELLSSGCSGMKNVTRKIAALRFG